MKKHIKWLLPLIIVALLLASWINPPLSSIREGDIIFQTSKSTQSKYIALATLSKYTHCGIICKRHGEWFVYEASNVVKFTPLQQFIDRGLWGRFKLRHVDCSHKLNFAKYLGKAYDMRFKWSDKRMYCSELVWKVYNDAGIVLCDRKKVSDYPMIHLVKRYMTKRAIDPNELVVAPSDLK